MTAWLGLGRGTLRRDLALAGVCLVGGLMMFALDYGYLFPRRRYAPVVFLVTVVAISVAVALRRISPVASVTLGTGVVAVDLGGGGSLATLLIFTQVLYDACVQGPPRLWRWLLHASVLLTGAAAIAGVWYFASWRGLALGVPAVLATVLPVVTGSIVRQYRDQAAAERARAEQTARLAELDRRQAISAERTRMARELHDVIANHLSAVAIHATAVLSVPNLKSDQVTQSLRLIRENSVQGLAEMRQMISLLRDPAGAGPADTATSGVVGPAGGTIDESVRVRLAELDQLVARVRDAGLTVRMEIAGEVRPLPVSVDLAAYRIVQESLTNALKHGSGTADLVVDYLPDRITVTVENPRAEQGSSWGAGAGLIGMRERAALLRGRLDAGPEPSRRWRVHAELPSIAVNG